MMYKLSEKQGPWSNRTAAGLIFSIHCTAQVYCSNPWNLFYLIPTFLANTQLTHGWTSEPTSFLLPILQNEKFRNIKTFFSLRFRINSWLVSENNNSFNTFVILPLLSNLMPPDISVISEPTSTHNCRQCLFWFGSVFFHSLK